MLTVDVIHMHKIDLSNQAGVWKEMIIIVVALVVVAAAVGGNDDWSRRIVRC